MDKNTRDVDVAHASAWEPTPRLDGKYELGINFFHEKAGRETFDSVPLQKYVELWDKKLLSFQSKGELKPDHLPTREEVAAFLVNPKKSLVKVSAVVVATPVPMPQVKKRPAPLAIIVQKEPALAPLPKKVSVFDWKKVAQNFLKNKNRNKDFDKKVVEAVVCMHEEHAMTLSDIAAEFQRRWSWASDMYNLRQLTAQVWLHTGSHLRWRDRLSKSELRMLCKLSPEAQHALFPQLLGTHTEPEHFDSINWTKMIVHTRDLQLEIDTIGEALAALSYDTVRDVSTTEAVLELRKDLEQASHKLNLLVQEVNRKL